MRPIMMQPSDKFESEYNVTGTPLGDCMKKRNLNNKDGWAARYQCINELSGCAAWAPDSQTILNIITIIILKIYNHSYIKKIK